MSSWIECPLEAIAQTTSGGTPDRKRMDFYGGKIPWVKSGELNDRYIIETEETLTPAGLQHSSAKVFPVGTLLMAMYGATAGKTAILKTSAATNQAVCAIFPNAEKADAEFLRYFLISEREELLKQRYGGAQPNISQNVICNFPVRLPPVSEQRKIASVLGLVQRAIEQQERLIALATELKKSLMHKLFTEGLHGERQKQTEIGPVPESWEVVPLSEGVSIKNGQVNPRLSPFREMIHVGPENIESYTGRLLNLCTNGELRISSGNYHFTNGDILYSKIRPYLKKAALPNFEGTCSADMYPLRSKENQFVRTFLFHLLLSDAFSKQAVAHQDRTGIPKINRVQLGSVLLPKPSLSEQSEIGETLNVADRRIDQLHHKRIALSDLFRTLLHQLMTAQIRVHDLDLSFLAEKRGQRKGISMFLA